MKILEYADTKIPLMVSLGNYCQIKAFIRDHNFLPNQLLPFDYVTISSNSIIRSLENNFEDWLDPSNFFSNSIHSANKKPLIVNKKDKNFFFTHDLSLEDYQTPIDDNKNLALKPESLQRFVENYTKRINDLHKIVEIAGESKAQKPSLIFIRNDKFRKLSTSSSGLFYALKSFCNPTPFILLHILKSEQEVWPEDYLESHYVEPELFIKDGKSLCFIFEDKLKNISGPARSNIILKNIFLTKK